MIKANEYRTVTCGELREENIGQQVRVAGWVENIRDHGGVMFLDIRDQYGVLQVVVHNDELLKDINKECTVTLSGTVVKRDEETINKKIATGFVEVHTEDIKVLGKCKNVLPFEVATSTNTNEEVRLKYRFLDLRNPKVHNNIMIRSQIITFLRNKMNEMGFMEIQTPILSTSSPEALVTTLSRAESTRADSMLSHRLLRFLNSSLWCQVLTGISRLHLASVMRTPVQTVHRVSSISLILKWLLQHRKMFLLLLKRFSTKHSRSFQIKRFQSLRLPVFRMPRVCSSTVQTSLTSAIRS